ncbi:MAG: S1 RNA-binding domain-containing protein [Clostridiales bacterium]|nr:S1 RNA-binding domain-containing protein [Clostridiales bacterium]
MTGNYRPEGQAARSDYTLEELQSAQRTGQILEARAAYCDPQYNLVVALGALQGFMPREECAVGIADGSVKNIAIITRVGRSVCFQVTGIEGDTALLSRRAAQALFARDVLRHLRPGDIIDCVVTRLAGFGAFVDVGCGVVSLITIDNISVSRIAHPSDRFSEGQPLRAVVKNFDRETGRLFLSHKELLGTWEQNIARFEVGQTVPGIVRSIEPYGIFVELTPNLAGLAEYQEGLQVGDVAVVYIKSILPDKMKLKLVIADHFRSREAPIQLHYYETGNRIEAWRYSPESCPRVVESLFSSETTP